MGRKITLANWGRGETVEVTQGPLRAIVMVVSLLGVRLVAVLSVLRSCHKLRQGENETALTLKSSNRHPNQKAWLTG